MARIALLSNPKATRNKSLLPRVRSFCAEHQDIFHYEVESAEQIAAAMKTIARVQPKVLVINGGDGTVQAALTELYLGGHFGDEIPPVAVLPNGKTNLIALDLGAQGDPIVALQRVLELAHTDMMDHIVSRELIELSDGDRIRPVLGMFLGGGALADTILYCRHKVYPLGLPNGFSHLVAAVAAAFTIIFGIRATFLPEMPPPLKVSVLRQGEIHASFAFLMVTTLHRLLLNHQVRGRAERTGMLQLMAVEWRPTTLIRALVAAIFGKLGDSPMSGVHLEHGDEIRIEGERGNVLLDGELFEAMHGRAILLKTTAPVPFLRLAA